MRVLLRLLARLKPHVWSIALVLGAMVGATVLTSTIPVVTGRAIDALPAHGGLTAAGWALIWRSCLIILLLSIVRGLFQFAQTSLAGRVGQRVLFDLRNDIYSHMQYLPFSYFDKAQTGQLLSRVTADVDSLRQFLGWGFIRMITQIFTLFFIGASAFLLQWRLALAAMITIPFLVWATLLLSRAIRPAMLKVQQEIATMNTVLQENLSGIRVVKAFGKEAQQIDLFQTSSENFLSAQLDVVQRRALYSPAIDFIGGVGMVVVLGYGGFLVIGEHMSVGTLIAFTVYMGLLLQPIRMLGFLVGNAEQAIAAGGRIFEILDTVPEIRNAPDAVELANVEGRVRFDNVSFAYDERTPVLYDITLDIKPGTTVAIVGEAGSGKTSLVNLIPRFYDPHQGAVYVDEHDVRRVTLESLRRNVGIIPQEPFIFSTSLRENIAFGREGVSDEEIQQAARLAQLHDFIVTLDAGYNTVVGERGIGLSGGQRQRLAIARALVTDPRILILDDSFSSLDTQTEQRIQQALADVLAGRTAFIIAHRLSTVQGADLVLVMKDGRIVQQGTHEELLLEEGPYRGIVEAQLREEERQAS